MLVGMKAIILAAGKGTRLRPLTYGIPKPLMPVKSKPMIDWVVKSLGRSIDEIIVAIPGTIGDDIQERTLSHIHGMCIDFYLKNAGYSIPIRTIPVPQKETAGDLRFILEETNIRNGQIIVVYGDNLTNFNIDDMVKYHNEARQELGISSTVLLFEAPEKELDRFGIAKIRHAKGYDLIERFVEKPKLSEAPSRLANGGYYILEVEDIFDLLPREKTKVEQSIFPLLAKENKLCGFITKIPFWIDISTIEAYENANKMAYDGLIIPPPTKEDNER
jgi:NDP-sugar pyrophosphorylase family protein